jgi:hypothetical protein
MLPHNNVYTVQDWHHQGVGRWPDDAGLASQAFYRIDRSALVHFTSYRCAARFMLMEISLGKELAPLVDFIAKWCISILYSKPMLLVLLIRQREVKRPVYAHPKAIVFPGKNRLAAARRGLSAQLVLATMWNLCGLTVAEGCTAYSIRGTITTGKSEQCSISLVGAPAPIVVGDEHARKLPSRRLCERVTAGQATNHSNFGLVFVTGSALFVEGKTRLYRACDIVGELQANGFEFQKRATACSKNVADASRGPRLSWGSNAKTAWTARLTNGSERDGDRGLSGRLVQAKLQNFDHCREVPICALFVPLSGPQQDTLFERHDGDLNR